MTSTAHDLPDHYLSGPGGREERNARPDNPLAVFKRCADVDAESRQKWDSG